MTNTIINNINADIISKANEANKAETERIVNTYQQMWGNGDSFIANDMAFLFGGAQRSGLNDDEEMAANDVARNWNAEHSNEKPIYMTTRAIEETFGSI